MKIVYIIRGLPGSGKSTFALHLRSLHTSLGDSTAHFEADMYMYENGEYVFRKEKLHYCHKSCLNDFMDAISNGTDAVIVSNTFIYKKHYKKYIDFAEENNYTIKVITINNHHGNRSIHDVPNKKILQMNESYQL